MRELITKIVLPVALIVLTVGAQADDFWWGVTAGLIYVVAAGTVLDLLQISNKDKGS